MDLSLATYELPLSLGLACVAGLLIGFEREQSAPERSATGEGILGGVRTHPLLSLIGAVAVLLKQEMGLPVYLAIFAAVVGLVAVTFVAHVRAGRSGMTSEAAALMSFLLGSLSMSHVPLAPIDQRALFILSLTVGVTLLLSIKRRLHSFVQKVSTEDFFATLKFLLVVVIILPLLPDQTFGPLDVLNPRSIGYMVVLIAGVSFVGYVAVRVRGAGKGMVLTGLIGGLVSSTAVTLASGTRARQEPALVGACALAVMAAGTIMVARVLVLAVLVQRALAEVLLVPLGAMMVAGLLVSVWTWRQGMKSGEAEGQLSVVNPFELSSAVKFALLYAGILLLSKAAHTYLGPQAILLAGALAGTTDVDAITLSMARLSGEGLSLEIAGTTVLIAVASNTVVKGVLAAVTGGREFGRRVAMGFAWMLAAGAIGVGWMWVSG